MLSGRKLRQGGVQEVNILPMVNSITKYSATINDPTMVSYHMDAALHHMLSGRPGPVWLEVPLDIQGTQIDPTTFKTFVPDDESSQLSDLDFADITKLLRLLDSSKRPLILAGHGVRLSGAAHLFEELISKLSIPTVCTWNALDLLHHDHPLYVGSPGVVALRPPNFALQNCDLLISIGCRLDNVVTAYAPALFAQNATIVSIDIDVNELQKHSDIIDLPICVDALKFIQILLEKASALMTLEWLTTCQSWNCHPLEYCSDSSTLYITL